MTDLPKVDRLELGKYSAQTVQNRLRDDTSEAHSITVIGINRNRSGGLRLGEIRSEGEVRDEGIHSGRCVCVWVMRGDALNCLVVKGSFVLSFYTLRARTTSTVGFSRNGRGSHGIMMPDYQ